MDISELQEQLNLPFHDVVLLEQALTHRSYLNEHSDEERQHNERLEFLGDAVIDFITADLLFKRFPHLAEGELTRLRAALVRTESLAELASLCRLGEAMFMGKGEEKGGGRLRLNNLCAAFEAVMGALYLDQGTEAVYEFLTPYLLPMLEKVIAEGLHIDARSKLQEWSQAHHDFTPVYRMVDEMGPDHEKEFMVEVLIEEEVVGVGTGRSKQSAAQSAARAALRQLQENTPPDDGEQSASETPSDEGVPQDAEVPSDDAQEPELSAEPKAQDGA